MYVTSTEVATIGIEKQIVRRVTQGVQQYLEQPANRKAQISSMSVTNAFLICALPSADMLQVLPS